MLFVESLQEAVDTQGCESCGPGHKHDELVLTARCHPGQGVDAVFQGGGDALLLQCHVCKQPVVVVAVASKESLNGS